MKKVKLMTLAMLPLLALTACGTNNGSPVKAEDIAGKTQACLLSLSEQPGLGVTISLKNSLIEGSIDLMGKTLTLKNTQSGSLAADFVLGVTLDKCQGKVATTGFHSYTSVEGLLENKLEMDLEIGDKNFYLKDGNVYLNPKQTYVTNAATAILAVLGQLQLIDPGMAVAILAYLSALPENGYIAIPNASGISTELPTPPAAGDPWYTTADGKVLEFLSHFGDKALFLDKKEDGFKIDLSLDKDILGKILTAYQKPGDTFDITPIKSLNAHAGVEFDRNAKPVKVEFSLDAALFADGTVQDVPKMDLSIKEALDIDFRYGVSSIAYPENLSDYQPISLPPIPFPSI